MAWNSTSFVNILEYTHPDKTHTHVHTHTCRPENGRVPRGPRCSLGVPPDKDVPRLPSSATLGGACGVVPRDGGCEGHVCTPSRPLWRAPNGSVPAGPPLQAGAPRSVLPYRPRPDVASGRL